MSLQSPTGTPISAPPTGSLFFIAHIGGWRGPSAPAAGGRNARSGAEQDRPAPVTEKLRGGAAPSSLVVAWETEDQVSVTSHQEHVCLCWATVRWALGVSGAGRPSRRRRATLLPDGGCPRAGSVNTALASGDEGTLAQGRERILPRRAGGEGSAMGQGPTSSPTAPSAVFLSRDVAGSRTSGRGTHHGRCGKSAQGGGGGTTGPRDTNSHAGFATSQQRHLARGKTHGEPSFPNAAGGSRLPVP